MVRVRRHSIPEMISPERDKFKDRLTVWEALMTANTMCVSCLLSKQEKIISDYLDANKKANYIEQVQEILNSYGSSESAPALAERINQL